MRIKTIIFNKVIGKENDDIKELSVEETGRSQLDHKGIKIDHTVNRTIYKIGAI